MSTLSKSISQHQYLKNRKLYCRIGLFSACAISSLLSGLYGTEKAFAATIDLTPETIKDHSITDNAIRWLEPPETPGDSYRINRWQMREERIGHLGIRNDDIFLEINGADTTQSGPNQLEIDRFSMQAGALSVTATPNSSLHLRHFDQTGGQVIIQATGENAIGLDFDMPALPGKDGQYEQQDGTVFIHAEEKGKGIVLDNDLYKKTGGSLDISAASGGKGITTRDTENNAIFEQGGGTTRIHASGAGSIGIQSQFIFITDGNLYLSANNGGRAIDLGEDGNFILNKGKLTLYGGANATSGWAIYGNSAAFGSESIIQPVLDLAAPERMNSAMRFSNVLIHEGATIKFAFTNTTTVASTDTIDIEFMEISDPEGKITGEFHLEREDGANVQAFSGSRLLYDYKMQKVNDDRGYIISLIPKQKFPNDKDQPSSNLKPSDYLSKTNFSAARMLEEGLRLRTPGSSAHNVLNRAYDTLYNSNNLPELQRNARGLHAYQATRFSSLVADSHDRFAHSFQNELIQAQLQPAGGKGEIPYLQPNPMVSWLKPLGGYNHYRADSSSYRGLDADYIGMTTGIAKRYHNMTAGAAFGFIQSDLTASENYSADGKTLLFTAGVSTGSFNLSPSFKPFFDVTAAYGRANFKQTRVDTLLGRNKSGTHTNSIHLSAGMGQEYSPWENSGLKFIPRATMEYTHIWQGSYREHGGQLPLDVASARFHSLRPKIGEEVFWPINQRLKLHAYGYYRYELLDTYTELKTGFIAIPEFRYMTMGQDSGRSSANAGLEMTYQLWEAVSISGSYDLLAANDRQTHQLYLQSNIQF